MRSRAAAALCVALCWVALAARAGGQPGVGGTPPAEYSWRLPTGFPQPRVPADNPMTAAKVELGRLLFFDRRLSLDGSLSCAGCHRPELAFTDGRSRARGATGELHPRSAPSLANVAYSAALGWADPEVVTLEQQVRMPLLGTHPIELGMSGREGELAARLAADGRYRELFARAFPGSAGPISMEDVARALASFERTLLSGASPYDRLLYRGDSGALSAAARRGMRLFFGDRLGCAKCHGGFTFAGPAVYVRGPEVAPLFHNTGLYNLDGRGAYPPSDPGLVARTGRAADMGRFRVPTLRNVALTAPYMHDGSIATLGEVIEHYAAGGRAILAGPLAGVGSASPLKSVLVAGFVLGPQDREDLLRFLESLTDEEFVRDARFVDPWPDLGGPGTAPAPPPPAGAGASARIVARMPP